MPAVDRPRLARFLADPARPANTLRYHELQGFLFVVASAPEVLPPSEWLPRIFGEAEAGEATLDHAMLGQIMALYHTITDTVLDPPAGLPPDCPLWADVLANFTDAAPIAQWARGFYRGYQWLDALWEETVPQALDEEFGSVVMTLIFFSSRKMAEAFHREVATDGQSFARTATEIHRVLPAAVAQYARLGRSVAAGHAAHAGEDVDLARGAMVGGHESCPCGSGKTYTHCCGVTVH